MLVASLFSFSFSILLYFCTKHTHTTRKNICFCCSFPRSSCGCREVTFCSCKKGEREIFAFAYVQSRLRVRGDEDEWYHFIPCFILLFFIYSLTFHSHCYFCIRKDFSLYDKLFILIFYAAIAVENFIADLTTFVLYFSHASSSLSVDCLFCEWSGHLVVREEKAC